MALSLTDVLNFAIFFVFMAVAIIPFYVAAKLGTTALGLVSFILGLFAVTHGVYHLLFAVGLYDQKPVYARTYDVGVQLVPPPVHVHCKGQNER